MFGIDYAYGNGVTAAQMKAAGVRFVCRYLAPLPNTKVIVPAEAHNILDAEIALVLNWEWTGRDVDRGSGGGHDDAREAARQAAALGRGLADAVIYFSPADYHAGTDDMPKLRAYFDGAATVLPRSRIGGYLDIDPLEAMLADRKIHWGWQPYAWAGGRLSPHAHLYQYQNDVRLGPARVDFDRSLKADFGQHPRPAIPPPPPAGPYRHVITAADRYTLPSLAASRSEKVDTLVGISRRYLSDKHITQLDTVVRLDGLMHADGHPHPQLPVGFTYYTINP